MGKGSQFEREVCKILSLWWTDGKREDVFWRTAGSGARATQRNKIGKKTFGQDGDVQATDPIGQPLIDLCSIEIKRGYSKNTIFDILDKPKKAKLQIYEQFINQSCKENKNSGAIYWMLITRRNRRETIVFIPYWFFKELKALNPLIHLETHLRFNGSYCIYALKLNSFLNIITPRNIKTMIKGRNCGKS